ncbi:hypothetical protein C8Q70DRAFT_374188 [Cubamyces menziesii]|nr:hypothetical protein C8Q70DRAFT_374188 [Cubamyces menziesii]
MITMQFRVRPLVPAFVRSHTSNCLWRYSRSRPIELIWSLIHTFRHPDTRLLSFWVWNTGAVSCGRTLAGMRCAIADYFTPSKTTRCMRTLDHLFAFHIPVEILPCHRLTMKCSQYQQHGARALANVTSKLDNRVGYLTELKRVPGALATGQSQNVQGSKFKGFEFEDQRASVGGWPADAVRSSGDCRALEAHQRSNQIPTSAQHDGKRPSSTTLQAANCSTACAQGTRSLALDFY